MEYMPTDLPQYVKTHTRSELANAVVASGHVLLFSEDGTSLTAKLPDGSFAPIGGGGSTDFYKCASVDTANSTWTGYKAVLSGGAYAFDSIATSGLTVSGYTPKVGRVYSADTAIDVTSMIGTIPTDWVFYDPLTSSTGWSTSGSASVVSDTTLGRNVFQLGSTYAAFYKSPVSIALPYARAPRTLSFWANVQSGISSGWGGVGWGQGFESYCRFCWGVINGKPAYPLWAYEKASSVALTADSWHHQLLEYSPETGKTRIYTDNVLVLNDTAPTFSTQIQYLYVGDAWEDQFSPAGKYASMRIYNRVLEPEERAALAAEFTPSVS